jgi:hypothetical protein
VIFQPIMNIQARQLLLCVSAGEALHRIKTVAEDLEIVLLPTESPEAIFDHPELTRAESIVVEFAKFGDEASLFLDHCRQRSPGTPIIFLLPRFSAAEAFRAGQCGVFNCFDLLATEEEWAASFQSAYGRVSLKPSFPFSRSTEPMSGRRLSPASQPREGGLTSVRSRSCFNFPIWRAITLHLASTCRGVALTLSQTLVTRFSTA